MRTRKNLSLPIFAVVYIAVALVCVGLDQLSKYLVFKAIPDGNSVVIIKNLLEFHTNYNAGSAFGMGQADWMDKVFLIITVVGIPLFAFLLFRSRTRSVWGQVGFAFIVGGTIGNAIDRIAIHATKGKFFSGEVRDFIHFYFFDPFFNVADSFLVVGVVLAILAIVFFDYDSLLQSVLYERAKKQSVAYEEQRFANAQQQPAQQAASQNTDAETPDEKN